MKKNEILFLKWSEKKRLNELIDKILKEIRPVKKEPVALKTHFGEEGNKGYIKPDLILPIISACKEIKLNPFITDTNTIYRGKRDNAVSHLTLAGGHGFLQNKLGIPVMIADGIFGKDYAEIEIDGNHFKKVKIASLISQVGAMIVLTHFKGHLLAGFGGAVKNLGMGCGAKVGKYEMHSGAYPDVDSEACIACGKCIDECPSNALELKDDSIHLNKSLCVGCGECVSICPTGALSISWAAKGETVQERVIEYALGSVKNKRVIYFNFLNHITANCDCLAKDEPSVAPDIGILAGLDPVAIDQASYDLVLKNTGHDVFEKAHRGSHGLHQLEYAQKMGLGKREYELKEI